MELPGALFKSKLEKHKNPPRKKFLIFCEMELSGSNIKKILIFRETGTPKKTPYISGIRNPKKLLIFREM